MATKGHLAEKVLLLVRTTPLEEVRKRTDGMTLLLADLRPVVLDRGALLDRRLAHSH